MSHSACLAEATAVTRRYEGHRVAFLTQHGKDDLLRPLMSNALGCDTIRADGFDTDLLGTFTRDIGRPGSQLAAARAKAAKAIELTGERIGLGSEGAFGADPVGGLLPWNTEVLVWRDMAAGIEVVGAAHGPGHSLQHTVTDEEALRRFADTAGFPAHGLVLRPDAQDDARIVKGLRDWPTLQRAFADALRASPAGKVFVETDLRAHMNPTRQRIIFRAAENLVARLQSACPACGSPGFWEKERISGLPCGLCGMPTRLPLAHVWQCDACAHADQRPAADGSVADPARCDCCNP